jgi:hypothetical protein
MKKTLLVALAITLLYSFSHHQANAQLSGVTMEFTGANLFHQNDGIENISPVQITDHSGGLITSESGLTIILPTQRAMLWEKENTALTATGPAVSNGRIAASVSVTYSADLLSVSIPILQTFEAGESFTLSGLKLRVYNREINTQPIDLDYTGDGEMDVRQPSGFKVKSITPAQKDSMAPYAVENLKATKDITNKTVLLEWLISPEPDALRFDITRHLIGVDASETLDKSWSLDMEGSIQSLDTTPTLNSTYKYTVSIYDGRNTSEPSTITIDFSEPPPTTTAAPTTTTQAPTTTTAAPTTTTQAPTTTAAPLPGAETVPDVEKGQWYYTYANLLVQNEILEANKNAEPGKTTTRGEFALWLAKAAGLYTPKAPKASLSDLSDASLEVQIAVNSLVEAKVIQGYPDGTYKPNKSVNRVEAAKILAAGLLLQNDQNLNAPFTDIVAGEWYQSYVDAAWVNSVVDGKGGTNTYGVNEEITHAATWKMIVLSVAATAKDTRRDTDGNSFYAFFTTPEALDTYLSGIFAVKIVK